MEYNDISILRLEEDEKVETFDCGDDDLNDFKAMDKLLKKSIFQNIIEEIFAPLKIKSIVLQYGIKGDLLLFLGAEQEKMSEQKPTVPEKSSHIPLYFQTLSLQLKMKGLNSNRK